MAMPSFISIKQQEIKSIFTEPQNLLNSALTLDTTDVESLTDLSRFLKDSPEQSTF
jgi:hypothetical protein